MLSKNQIQDQLVDPIFIKKLLKLNQQNADKRKIRIKKIQYIQYAKLITENFYNPKTDKRQRVKSYYISYLMRLKKEHKDFKTASYTSLRIPYLHKIALLELIDNYNIILAANNGYYLNSHATLIKLSNIIPKHFENITKALQKKKYILPNIFKPLKFKR